MPILHRQNVLISGFPQPVKISERSILCFRVAALFLCPPAKFSSSLHSPTVFCKFTSKMVGGFLLLQARSCFLKFFRICRVFVAFSGPFSAYKNRKAHDLHRIFNGQSWVLLGALEGTRIPGPLIKSQMLYRLSYERIHYKAQYNTILPNNITILPGKKQAFCTKNFPKAVIGQILPRTAPLQTGQEPVQSKQFITKLQPTCRAHFRAGQADPIGGLFP